MATSLQVTEPLEGQKPLMERLAEATGGQGQDDTASIHGLHPWAAKYIAELPRTVIAEHTNERNTVLDPFCGSGTTLVEGALLGRKTIGIDSNPIAALISRAKTHALDTASIERARELIARVERSQPSELPAHEQASSFEQHWFQPGMSRELAWLRDTCESENDATLRDFFLCVLSSVIVAASNQDSETRYTAKAKEHPDGYALERFARKLRSAIKSMEEFAKSSRARRNPSVVHAIDATNLAQVIDENTIDLIVTSPPYPNSYDYYLYHKLRMWWLGFDHKAVQRNEIGSRHEHSSQRASVDVFSARITPVLAAMAKVLKPSKLAYLFVGDSVIGGQHIDMEALYRRLGVEAGLGYVDSISYDLQLVSRSFKDTRSVAGNRHGHRKLQHVLVFEGKSSKQGPNRRHIAQPAPSSELVELAKVTDGSKVAIASEESNRHVHSLASYPSKFIPEIPRWAIERYSAPGDVVLDPFAGSGTTAVEALLLGRSAVSVDLSPYAALLSQAKTTRVPEAELREAAAALEDAARHSAELPEAARIRFSLDDFWFSLGHLDEFARLLAFVEDQLPVTSLPFFKAVLASTIRSFSYQDAGQIKVKRDPRKVMRGTRSPSELLLTRLPGAVDRLARYGALAPEGGAHSVHQASAEAFLSEWPTGAANLIVTSPPYINAMNYAMIQRYELLLLGLVPPSTLNSHQASYIGTERVYARDYGTLHRFPADHPLAGLVNDDLAEIFEAEPKRSYIVYRYLDEMSKVCESMISAVEPGGHIVLVAGTNVIRGVPIDTFRLLAQLLEAGGAETVMTFHYEIHKQSFKLRRHQTANLIPHDGVAVLRAP
jgi:site-specific DNA-methyltransferase (cytosine-N4-specific)